MVRGGWLGIILLVLLLVPSVSASLSMTCPYPSGVKAQATHPFSIRADDSAASTIKLRWQGSWHTFSGTYAIGTITESIDKEHTWQRYFAESYDSSGNLLDSTHCDVYIDSANFPGSVSASPSSLSLVIGQAGSVTVSASDEDGIHKLMLGGASHTCYNGGGSPTSCTYPFTVSYTSGGTYQLTPSVQDAWGNTVTGAPVTITVTDPCASSSCGLCAEYSSVCTTYSGGSLCNPADPGNCYDPESHCTKTYAGTDTLCQSTPTSHCDGQGTCVPDCQQTNGGVEICDNTDNDCNGVVDDNVTDCPGLCVNGQCVGCASDTDCPDDGWYDTTTLRNVSETCRLREERQREQRDYTCTANQCAATIVTTDWQATGTYYSTNDGASCTLDGGGAGVCSGGACVACRDDGDCAGGETCQGGACVVPAACASDSDCDDNDACTVDTCSGNVCSYAAVAPICNASSVACGQVTG